MSAEMLPEGSSLSAGEAAILGGRWAEALEHFRVACKGDPSSARAFQGLSVALFWLERREESWEAACKAYDLDPNDVDSRLNLQDLARELGRQEIATKILLASGHDPNPDPSVSAEINICQQAETFVETAAYERAIQAFIEALDLQPGSPRAWGGLGVACFRKGHRRVSRAFFEMAVRLDPEDSDSVLNLAETTSATVSDKSLAESLSTMGVDPDLVAKALAVRKK